MYNSAFRRPGARRAAALLATAVLLGSAAPALASDVEQSEGGKASAAVLRAGLDVALLNRAIEVPLSATLNEVTAPAGEPGTADKTALTATLDGVDDGRPFHLLRADVASARASVDDTTAEARVELAAAKVHVPGLPLLSVIEIDAVTAEAVCTAGERPTASAMLGTQVTVLGQQVTLTLGQSSTVSVPGVGEVRLDLAKEETTSSTAAATALALEISVNPLNLNVAEVDGRVALAEVGCESPAVPEKPKTPEKEKEQEEEPEEKEQDEAGPRPQTGQQAEVAAPDLAATGGGGNTPYLVGGAVVLLGGGTLMLLRRRWSGQG